MVAPSDVLDQDVHRQRGEEGAALAELETEPVAAGLKRSPEEVGDPSVGVGHHRAQLGLDAVRLDPQDRDRQPRSWFAAARVEDVAGDRRRPVGHVILRGMARLQIVVGDLHFSARWEAAAPKTIEAIRRMLPIEASLIHCRWSGESTWIPYGDLRPGIDYENHTSHPAPGQLAMYPGGISECEIFFPYGACTTSSKVGQLAANHFASIEPDGLTDLGWAERLREVGRRCLWQGAQAITIREVD